MKIGKYPVKHTYSIARLVADVLSVGIAVLIVSATLSFFKRYDDIYSSMLLMSDTAKETLLANDPNYEWKQWLALIFPVLMLAVFIVYIVLVLKSHKFSRYNVTKRNAQQCCDAYTFCVSLCKIPVLIIIADIMAIVHDKLLPQYGFGWFSWPVLLYALILAMVIRFTMHKLEKITAAKPAEGNADVIKVRAVQKESSAERAKASAEDNKEDV